jgi:hypothetical protein
MKVKNITPTSVCASDSPQIRYLVGVYEDGDFLCLRKTQDIDKAIRFFYRKKDLDKTARLGIIMSSTTFTPIPLPE